MIEPGGIRTEWSGIAADRAEETSGHGPYAAQARAVATSLRDEGYAARTSSPQVVADAIARAVRARRPKTRYAVGYGAKLLIRARRILADRQFDALIRRAMRPPRGS